ncbi:MAG: ATP-binding protein [Candidatus Margulisiibacteriota bacterium]
MLNIDRSEDEQKIAKLIEQFPVTAILGPRQSGKTTIVSGIKAEHRFDLENPRDLAVFDNPQTVLENCSGTIVIDEIQRKPELFPLLRYLVDTHKNKQKYIILGSASKDLIKQSSESLAGRIAYYELGGFRLQDIGPKNWPALWYRGKFPLSYLAQDDQASAQWREQYITSFLERDIPQLGISIPANILRRFWLMLCDYHGNIINHSELGRAFGISDTTVRRYLEILQSTFMIRLLQPWHANISKRQVKNPKLFIRDAGIFHALLGFSSLNNVYGSVKVGASWEGFVLEEIVQIIQKRREEVFFWRTHNGAELDMLWMDNGTLFGVECKFSDSPKLTPSMLSALEDLKLAQLWIVYPGDKAYSLHDKVKVVPFSQITAKDLFIG